MPTGVKAQPLPPRGNQLLRSLDLVPFWWLAVCTGFLRIRSSISRTAFLASSGLPRACRESGNLLPNNHFSCQTTSVSAAHLFCQTTSVSAAHFFIYCQTTSVSAAHALCHLLYPVSAVHASILRMDSNSTSYVACLQSRLVSSSHVLKTRPFSTGRVLLPRPVTTRHALHASSAFPRACSHALSNYMTFKIKAFVPG